MPTYLTPGVYVEEVSSGSKPIEGVATSVAAFIGVAERGPLNKPVSIVKMDDYENAFGGYLPPGTTKDPDKTDSDTGETIPGKHQSYLAHAVRQFFANGGSRCYVIRVATTNAQDPAEDAKVASATGLDNVAFLTDVKAAYKNDENPGSWANDHYTVYVSPSRSDPSHLFDLEVRYWPTLSDITESDEREWEDGPTILESYTDLSHWRDSSKYAPDVVNKNSKYVSIDISNPADYANDIHPLYDVNTEEENPETYQFTGGSDGAAVKVDDVPRYRTALESLDVIKDVRLIAIPGIPEQALNGVGYCDNRAEKDCIFFMDSPVDESSPTQIKEWADGAGEGATPSSYAVLYYPWVEAANFGPKGGVNWFPPSAFAMGMCGRIDQRRGVWKAPAGVETSMPGIQDVRKELLDKEQEMLNPRGINCLRVITGTGTVIWGTRTRSTRADPEWRYLPVRRTAIMIERSIYAGIQWAVFEPNGHRLWSALRANIGNFMDGLFRAGAFQGEKASDAFFVRCGLGDTMSQGEIDEGKVIVQVGFAPLKPAEFVIVRIQQKVNQK